MGNGVYSWHADNMKVFCKLILSFWVCIARQAQSTQNRFPYLSNICRKMQSMKLIFCLQISKNVFYKFMVSLCVWVARHAQKTQNNKFAISLDYLKENAKDEVDFLPADKCQSFLQIDTIILVVCGQSCPNYLSSNFAISLQYLKKEVSDEVDFLHTDKHECFLQIAIMIFDGGCQSL